MLREAAPVSVIGDGMAEVFAWKTESGFAVHVLNYNNPDMLRGWFTQAYPLGPQRVRFAVSEGMAVTRVRLLRAGIDVPFSKAGGGIEFTIPQVVDYEVAAIT
jgi:hypothetical protein